MKFLKLFFFLFFLLFSLPLSSHKFYTSITHIEYNEKTHSAEIICNVFTDDLEKCLSEYFHQKIKIDDENMEAKVKEYLGSVFYIKNSRSQLKKMELIGIEVKNDLSSIYLEVPMPEGIKKGSLLQVALTEFFPEQVNVVNLKYKSQMQSLVFRKNSKEQTFKF